MPNGRHHTSSKTEADQMLHSLILNAVTNGIYFVRTSDHKIVYANAKSEQLFGYKPGELISQAMAFITFDDSSESARQITDQIVSELNRCGEWKGEIQNRRKDGSPFWSRATIKTFEHPDHGDVWVYIHEDITELKKIQAQLEHATLLNSAMQEAAPIGYLAYSSTGDCIMASRISAAMIGATYEQVLAQNWKSLASWQQSGLAKAAATCMATGEPQSNVFHVQHTTFGRDIWLDAQMVRFAVEDQLYLLVTTVDITEHKKSQEALRESEERYRNLFNNAEVGIFRTRLDGSELLEANRRYFDIFGMTDEEMLGKPSIIRWVDPNDRAELVKKIQADGSISELECKFLNKRGEVRNCITSLRLYRDQGILEGSILDITERKKAEDRIQTILRTTIDGFYLVDKKGKILA